MIFSSAARIANYSEQGSAIYYSIFTLFHTLEYVCLTTFLTSDISNPSSGLFCCCYGLKHINIPSVMAIPGFCFQECWSLERVVAKSLTTAGSGYYTYYGAKNLKCVSYIPQILSRATYNIRCLAGCYLLEKICYNGFDSSDDKIGNSFMQNCRSVKRIILPSQLVSISIYAFQNVYSLEKLYCKPTTPPSIDSNAFSNLPSFTIIYVPTGTLATYQAATNWSNYASQMVEYDYDSNPDNI